MSPTASPSRKICTSCPASARANPCRKGNAALVGSSDPHALFIMILSDLWVACPPIDLPAEAKGSTANCANRDRNRRRTMSCSLVEESYAGRPYLDSGLWAPPNLHGPRSTPALGPAQQRHRSIGANPRSHRRKNNIGPVLRVADHSEG